MTHVCVESLDVFTSELGKELRPQIWVTEAVEKGQDFSVLKLDYDGNQWDFVWFGIAGIGNVANANGHEAVFDLARDKAADIAGAVKEFIVKHHEVRSSVDVVSRIFPTLACEICVAHKRQQKKTT